MIVAPPALGTINHTLLTIEAARAAGLEVAPSCSRRWPAEPGELELSNRETIAELGDVAVETLPEIDLAEPGSLAAARDRLTRLRSGRGSHAQIAASRAPASAEAAT